MDLPKDRTEIASDVSNGRNGIGIQVFRDNNMVIEIFRDDTKRTRTVTLFQWDVALDLVEETIAKFKKEIPWQFIDDNE